MDYESSTKFISSLAKFLQSLCNGYVEFDNGVQVIGHLYLNVDTGRTIDYVLNEKVCKTDENSVTFISNSFHAQPAEKPKPFEKRPNREPLKDSKPDELNNGNEAEPRNTNAGATASDQNYGSQTAGSKRPYSPLNKQKRSPSGRVSPRNKKSRTDYYESNNSAQAASENIDNHSPGVLHQHPSNSDPSFSESYQQNFLAGDETSVGGSQEQGDIKPSFDTDVTFIKEEYAPASNLSESNQDDEGRGDNSSMLSASYSDQPFPPGGYGSQGDLPLNQRSTFHPADNRSMFSSGPSQLEGTDMSSDPSEAELNMTCRSRYGIGADFECNKCHKRFTYAGTLTRHRWKCEGTRYVECQICGRVFNRLDVLKRHMRRLHLVG